MVKYAYLTEDKILNEDKNFNEESPSDDEVKGGISADLIRGHINTIILRTLYERDKYGYEIIEEIEQKSHGQYSLKQPTLYSALKRLETQGYITAYWKTDEVSQGGRRKYYTLTDSGREVTERNRSEWEYSRTVIDNLISDRNFDFNQPAPTSVDFKILKNSTSRVPVIKDEETEEPVRPTREVIYEEEIKREQAFTAQQSAPAPVEAPRPAPAPTPVEAPAPAPAHAPEQPYVPPVIERQYEPRSTMTEEERRIAHENYVRLVSPPVENPVTESPAYYSDGIDTEKLIYNNKPDTERDYRNLINNLYMNAMQSEAQPYVPEKQSTQGMNPVVRFEEASIMTDGRSKIKASEYQSTGKRTKRFNLSAILLKCSLIVLVVMMLEFALCLIFKDDMAMPLGYPFVIFALGAAQTLIFSILYLTKVGKSAKKPATITYLTASIVVTVILIVLICVLSLLINVNFSSTGDIMKKIVIPCFVALNIPIFTVLMYVFIKHESSDNR